MLKEALEYLLGNHLKRSHQLIGSPDVHHVVHVFDPDTGALRLHEVNPRPVSAIVTQLNDIWIFLNTIQSPYSEVNTPSIWISDSEIRAFADTTRLVSSCKLQIVRHHAIHALRVLTNESSTGLSHTEFLNLLRHTLFGVEFLDCPDLISIVSSLKFETGNSTESKLTGIGDSSVSKQHLSKVTGAKEIPSEVELAFPYSPSLLPHYNVVVKCGLIVDSVNARIKLIPRPGELDRVTQSFLNALKEELLNCENSDSDVPILFGRV